MDNRISFGEGSIQALLAWIGFDLGGCQRFQKLQIFFIVKSIYSGFESQVPGQKSQNIDKNVIFRIPIVSEAN